MPELPWGSPGGEETHRVSVGSAAWLRCCMNCCPNGQTVAGGCGSPRPSFRPHLHLHQLHAPPTTHSHLAMYTWTPDPVALASGWSASNGRLRWLIRESHQGTQGSELLAGAAGGGRCCTRSTSKPSTPAPRRKRAGR